MFVHNVFRQALSFHDGKHIIMWSKIWTCLTLYACSIEIIIFQDVLEANALELQEHFNKISRLKEFIGHEFLDILIIYYNIV